MWLAWPTFESQPGNHLYGIILFHLVLNTVIKLAGGFNFLKKSPEVKISAACQPT